MTSKINNKWNSKIQAYDDRRDIVIPGNYEEALKFCVDHFIQVANKAIEDHSFFAVALSGGSTPKAIYEKLSQPEFHQSINWNKMLVFWSDERCVPLDHPESNYKMAIDGGFSNLPIPKENIFPMKCKEDLQSSARDYEKLITSKIPSQRFDLVMLGMGDDGHTASLFPKTHGLHPNNRLVIENYVPKKETWRMSLTFDCINQSNHIAIYVFGKNKAKMVKKALSLPYSPDEFPVQRVGTPENKALWILDDNAASEII